MQLSKGEDLIDQYDSLANHLRKQGDMSTFEKNALIHLHHILTATSRSEKDKIWLAWLADMNKLIITAQEQQIGTTGALIMWIERNKVKSTVQPT